MQTEDDEEYRGSFVVNGRVYLDPSFAFGKVFDWLTAPGAAPSAIAQLRTPTTHHLRLDGEDWDTDDETDYVHYSVGSGHSDCVPFNDWGVLDTGGFSVYSE